MSSATQNLTFNSNVALTGNQTWSIASGRSLLLGNVANGFSDGGNTLALTGAGTFDVRATNTFGSNVTIGTTTMNVNATASTVTLGGSNTFDVLNIYLGRASGATISNFGVASHFGDGGTNSAITVGGNNSSGVLEYTGSTASTNRTVTRDARSSASGIDVTTAGQTLTISGNLGSGSQVNTGANGWVFGGAGNLTLSGVISNSTGVGSTGTTITKNGAGILTLSRANTFSGGLTINTGTVVASVNSSLGTGSVTINDGATLTLQTNSILNDNSYLYLFGTTSLVNMDFSGSDTLSNIFVNGTGISTSGLYSSSALNTLFGATYFAGTGSFNVLAIPEPSTYLLFGITSLVLVFVSKRRFKNSRQTH
jgi:autotransporter-associated beta strand protein